MDTTLQAGTKIRTFEDATYRKVSWRLVPFLMVCFLIAYLDRVNVGFAKLQMSQQLGFSETVYGLGAGIFFIGYFLFEVPSNLALHKFGAKVWIGRIMITWGILSACFAFVQTPTQFYTLRFLLGLAEAGFTPGIVYYLSCWYPSHRRAKIMAIYCMGSPLSGIIGNPLSGFLMGSMAGVSGLGGWQWMFVIEAVPAVLLGCFCFYYLDNSIAKANWLTSAEKQVLELAKSEDVKAVDPQARVGKVFTDPRVWLISLICFCYVTGQYGITLWLPTFIRSTGVSDPLHIGMLSAIPYMAAIVSMYFFGRSADKHRERRWHLIIPCMMGAIGFLALPWVMHNTALSLVFLSIAAAGILTCTPLFWSLPTAFLSGAALATAIAMSNSIGNLAGFTSGYMIGYLRDVTQSGNSAYYMIAGMLMLGAFCIWTIPARLVNR
ncbi:Sugar phosphate permease [Cupriavidus necator]|uniref:Putative tartrate transporter n=1 Tax=Cupriavidus necator (strain ATCC 17699 / DSM 428 / KCTC 22496 / NCIMB 10442 / H16 / Stanier 337) TaxID=381666 RepID=Q0K212_CUPNH|nr:MFS transporter [Cupriavidus necator]QCC03836.1 MFS transporter [Cupriavidus necator H16]QQB80895.1 MFS transporter [Cupriavidus necator]WKA45196.1 MFS transporter [Cupriavidus necator]CAJ95962.1 MFS transporter [Cupriavidus necator H16]